MNCLIGSPFNNSVESKTTRFEYWYGIETSSDDIESFRYDLESAIYHEAIANIVWCTEDGNRRVEETGGAPYYVDEQGRRLALGVMAVSSAPVDVVQTDSACTQELKTEGDNCFLVQGIMSIMSHATDDMSLPISYIQQGIKEAMESDSMLNSQARGDLSVITRVVHLGESDPTAIKNDVFARPEVSEGIRNINGQDNSDQGNDNYSPIMAFSFLGAACVMLLVLLGVFLVKRRQRKTTAVTSKGATPPPSADDATFGEDTIVSFHEDIDDGIAVSPPPPSDDDLRAQVIAAERQHALEKGLGTIPEDRT